MINDRFIKKKIVAPLILLAGATIFFGILIKGFFYTTNDEIKSTPQGFSFSEPRDGEGLPVRIIIPKIDLDTKVEHVGVTFKGNMSTPKNIGNTGWYKYGTIPGELGSAVIDGHVDNGFNLPGVFYDLRKLEVGDDVYLKTDNNKDLHFVVVEKAIYPYKEVPRDILFNKNDAARLNLITCDGEWIDEEETDENRLVVYTRLVE